MVAKIRCPEGHEKIWRKGQQATRKGMKTRYFCAVCGRTFYKSKLAKKSRSK